MDNHQRRTFADNVATRVVYRMEHGIGMLAWIAVVFLIFQVVEIKREVQQTNQRIATIEQEIIR